MAATGQVVTRGIGNPRHDIRPLVAGDRPMTSRGAIGQGRGPRAAGQRPISSRNRLRRAPATKAGPRRELDAGVYQSRRTAPP